MKVRLLNPDRDVDLAAGRKVHEILDELGIDANAVVVIRRGIDDVIEEGPLVAGNTHLRCKDTMEIYGGAR